MRQGEGAHDLGRAGTGGAVGGEGGGDAPLPAEDEIDARGRRGEAAWGAREGVSVDLAGCMRFGAALSLRRARTVRSSAWGAAR